MNILFSRTARNTPVIFLAGFHDSPFPDGEVFFNSCDAEEYVSDKVIYVMPITYYTDENMIKFVKTKARAWINHVKYVCGHEPIEHVNEIACNEFRGLVIEMINDDK